MVNSFKFSLDFWLIWKNINRCSFIQPSLNINMQSVNKSNVANGQFGSHVRELYIYWFFQKWRKISLLLIFVSISIWLYRLSFLQLSPSFLLIFHNDKSTSTLSVHQGELLTHIYEKVLFFSEAYGILCVDALISACFL